jgi:FlaA1/EpsC-like NDP-sugar epimerase
MHGNQLVADKMLEALLNIIVVVLSKASIMPKTILITGANGNLGAATVKKFLDEGYKSDRRRPFRHPPGLCRRP